MIGSTYLCLLLWKSGFITIFIIIHNISSTIIICEEYFYFHKIFQETQEHLCYTAVVVLFTFILQAYR